MRMSLITGSLRDVLSIKLKYRDDDYTDQFNRIFMVKMFIISSIVMSFDYFSDKVNCIVPKHSSLSRDFVHSVCWIQGFYIYKELENRISESGYYGIPKDIELDGMHADGKLCRRINKASHLLDPSCHPMTKIFFLQFQYFPFFIASLAILYYFPYILFRMANSDLISLKKSLKDSATMMTVDARKIVNNYFQYSRNGGKFKLRLKIFVNVLIKCTYVFASVLSFCVTNLLLHGNYQTYGFEWLKWTKMNNSLAYDFNGKRETPKPGNVLLPSMGFCDIMEGSNDIRSTFTDKNKFICEISPNVLYQYVLIVLWYMFVISIVIAVVGVLINILSNMCLLLGFSYFFCHRRKDDLDAICKKMTFREMEYLRFIRSKDMTVYGDVIRLLQKQHYQNFDGHIEFEGDENVCKDHFLNDQNNIGNPPYNMDKL